MLLVMRPSSLGGGRILRRTLSVRLSVCPSRYGYRASRRATKRIKMTHMYLSHALRAAYRTAISAAQILVYYLSVIVCFPIMQDSIC